MKFISKISLIAAFVAFASETRAQLIVNTDQLNGGNFKDQQTVKLVPGLSTGQTTLSANINTNGHLFIDPSVAGLIQYSGSPLTLSDIQNHQLDFSLPVGAIPASYAVNSSGGLAYSIPISLPSGTNGMVPGVSIAYHSGSFGQIAGLGWGISGVSVINRVPTDYYHDSWTLGVQLDQFDNFEYNGSRLIQVQNSPVLYGLENEDFTRIKHIMSGPNGDYFMVETKEGTKIELGNSTNSRLLLNNPATNTPVPYSYYINKITDVYGNYIQYDYINASNEVLLAQIDYTGFTDNQGVQHAPYNSIRFYYDNRIAPEKKYKLGNLAINSKILREIEILTEGTSVKKFDFTYSFNDKYHLLNKIDETGSDGTQLNSTLVVYGNGNAPILNNTVITDFTYSNDASTGASTCGDYRIGDFNGDGLSDILAFTFEACTVATNSGGRAYNGWQLYLNTGNSNFSLSQSKSYPPGTINAYASFNYGTSWNHNPIGTQNGDFNGDGMEDMLLGVVNASNDIYDLYLSDGTNLTSTGTTQNIAQGSSLVYGDFNGDKKIEVMSLNSATPGGFISFLYYENGSFKRALDPLNGQRHVITVAGTQSDIDTYNGFNAFDFDGDGVTDLSALDGNGHEVIIKIKGPSASPNLKLLGAGAFFELEEIYNSGVPATDYLHILYGDYNGDGLPDKLNLGHGLVWADYGTGTGYTNGAGSPIANFPTYWQHMDRMHISADINGDGISEIVYLDCSSGDLAVAATFLRSMINESFGVVPGTTFPLVKDFTNITPAYINHAPQSLLDANMDFVAGQVEPIIANIGSANDDARPADANKNPEFNTGDFNGDGYTDIMLKIGTSGERMILYFNPYDKQNLVTHVVNGFNNRTDFDYEPLSTTNSPGFYTKGSGSTFPVRDFKGALYAVSSITEPDGVGGTTQTTYRYEDAKLHTQAKGFLGFGKMTTYNGTKQIQKIDENKVPDATFFVRLPDKTSINIASTPVSQKTFSSSIFTFGNGTTGNTPDNTRIFVKTDKITSFDAVKGVTDVSEFYFDGSMPGAPVPITAGNLTYTKETNGNGTEEIESMMDYISGNWLQFSPSLKSRLELSTKKVRRKLPTQQPDYVRTSKRVYDPLKGVVIQIISEPGDLKSVTTTNTYFPNNGLLQQQDMTALNSPQPLPVHTTLFEYDANMRLPVKTTAKFNPNDLVTETQYDFKFGVPVTSKDVDGLVTKSSYDGFGRLLDVETPDHIVSSQRLYWYQPGSVIDLPGDPHPITAGLPLFYLQNTRPGSPTQTAIFDILGRNFKTQADGFNNDVTNFTSYDSKGQVSSEVNEYVVGNTVTERALTNYVYNNLGQPTDVTIADEAGTFNNHTSIGYAYNNGNATTTVQTPDGKTITRVTDPIGALITATDGGGSLQYEYGSHGQPLVIKLNGSPISTMEYDPLYGQQTKLTEANTGETNYEYNAYGQLYMQKDFNNNQFFHFYDELGRTKTITGPENYDYQYVNSGYGVGQLKQITNQSTGITHQYLYDALSRLAQFDETVDGSLYSAQYQYDNFSNLSRQTYPSGFAVKRDYNSKGYPTAITRIDNGNMIWQADAMERAGMLTKYTLGNHVQTVKTFDALGMPKTSQAGVYQSLLYNFNNVNGNLNSISDLIAGRTENYQYDANHLDRLTQWQVVGGAANTIAYTSNGNGNIDTKTDIGAYTYNTKPNAVVLVDNTAGLVSGTQEDIAYTSFNKIKNITEGSNEAYFTYGPDQEREKMELKTGGQTISTKYYLSEYEKEVLPNGNTREVHYINAPYGLCAMYVNDAGNKNMYYVYSDHVGSINTLADDNGNTIKQNFDPWGRARNPQTWDFNNVPAPPAWLTRGYTTHEHLPQFSLINMNGRLYDPMLARMLSPDNEVSDATFTQAHNRYSYALNNPLKYTDPTGNSPLPGVYYQGSNAILSPGSTDFSSFNPANADWTVAAELRQNLDDVKQDLHGRLHDAMYSHENGKGGGGGPSERYSWTGARNNWGGSSSTSLGSLASEISANYTASAATFTGTPWNREKLDETIYAVHSDGRSGGVTIDLGFKNIQGENVKNLQWIQSVWTNVPGDKNEKSWPYRDPLPVGKNKTANEYFPYYASPYEVEVELPKRFGYPLTFYDESNRDIKNNTYWIAELSLVKKGKYLPFLNTPLITLNYGFKIQNNQVTLFPIRYSTGSYQHRVLVNAMHKKP